MKKLLLILAFLIPLSASATTTVTGTIGNLGTGTIGNGAFVRFWLRGCNGNQPRVNGTAIIGPSQGGVFYFDFIANASGVVSGTLYSTRDSTGNNGGDIECGGSETTVWYGMQVFVGGKGGPEVPVHAKNGVTLDITQVVPLVSTPGPAASGTFGLRFVSSLPALCTPGTTGAVQLSVSPYSIYFCSATNTWSATGAGDNPGVPPNSIQYNCASIFCGAPGITTPDNGNSLNIKGPTPWIDPVAYGGSGSKQTTTCSINSGTATLTLASAIDFANGQGIACFGAGPTSTAATPTGTAGSQIIKVAQLASNGTVIATGGSFGENGITCTSGTATATTWGFHGFPNGGSVTIAGTTNYNGTYTITVTNGYQFTFAATCNGTNQGGTATLSATGAKTFNYKIVSEDALSGYSAASANIAISTAQPLSPQVHNHLSWSQASGATQYLVYGDQGNGGSLVCLGPASVFAVVNVGNSIGQWDDYGTQQPCPSNAPTNPPGSATAGILIATINSGGGTTSLGLSASASNTVSAAVAQHDETTALNNAIQAAANIALTTFGGGGIVRVPIGTWHFQTLLFPVPSQGGKAPMEIDYAGQWEPRQPINITQGNYTLNGLGGGTYTAFGGFLNSVIDQAGLNPVIFSTYPASEVRVSNTAILGCPGDCIDFAGGTDDYLTNDSLTTNTMASGFPFHIHELNGGAFGMFVTGGVYNSGNPALASIDDTNTGELSVNGTNLNNSGIAIHGGGTAAGIGFITITGSGTRALYEDGTNPLLTLDPNGVFIYNVELNNAIIADPVAGQDVSAIYVTGPGNQVGSIRHFGTAGSTYGFFEGPGAANIAGYMGNCVIATASCTGTVANGYQLPVPGGWLMDNTGAMTFVQNSQRAVPPIRLVPYEPSAVTSQLTVENPFGTPVFSLNGDGGLTSKGTVDLSAASLLKVPIGVTNTSANSGALGFDSNGNLLENQGTFANYLIPVYSGSLNLGGVPILTNPIGSSTYSYQTVIPVGGSFAGGQSPVFASVSNLQQGQALAANNSGIFTNQYLGIVPNTQTSTYSLVGDPGGDRGKSLYTNSNITIPQAGSNGFPSGYFLNEICNNGTSAITATPTTSTISTPFATGLTSVSIGPGSCWRLTVGSATGNGTWLMERRATVLCSGTVVLGTSAISSAAKGNSATSTCTGLTTSDAVIQTANAEVFGITGFTPSASGILTINCWPTANTVNCEEENNTSGSITPAAVTVNYMVMR